MILSRKAKEAIKTALAMTIAYGIALSMDWDRPYWAGFAVAFVSQATVGLSVNRAALRMLGTVLAAIVALSLIAGFAQDRWLFILSMLPFVCFCCYMMGGPKYQYFWQVSGFVVIIVCFDSGPDPVNAFDTAVLRVQETGLGILVYSLVALFIWPVHSRSQFETVARDLAATQHQLFAAYRSLMSGEEGKAKEASQIRAQQAQQQARFGQLLNAAISDSYEVRELQQPWRQYQGSVQKLATVMERWHDSFAETRTMDLTRLLPGLPAYLDEIDHRLEQIGLMLAGEAPQRRPGPVELTLDSKATGILSHFDRAAIAVLYRRMQALEDITRAAFDALSGIRGYGQAPPIAGPARPRPRFLPDPDRLACVARFLTIVLAAYLAFIYVEGWPGGAGFVGMAGALGMALVNAPQLPISKIYAPVTVSALSAGVLYIFVMPQLATFLGLGALIFAVTLVICYSFAEPQQMLGRAFGLALFVVIASISNEQTYNFLGFATTVMMFAVMIPMLALTVYFPISWRPERVFLRQLRRFFRSCDVLISTVDRPGGGSINRRDRWRKAFHLQEVATLPNKLGTWAPRIDPAALADATPEDVRNLVAGLGELSLRMQAMVEASKPVKSEALVQALEGDMRSWSASVQGAFQHLSDNPAAATAITFRARLTEIMDGLEQRIEDVLDRSSENQMGPTGAETFYSLLGAYRGVSEALVSYAGLTERINWDAWREERF